MIRPRRLAGLWASLWLTACAGCSLWIDDFDVGTASEITTGTAPVDTADTTGHGTVTEPPDPGNCDLSFPMPGGAEIELCALDIGTFRMGCDASAEAGACGLGEEPAHDVFLTRFQLTRHEITRGEYAAFLAANPAWRKGGEEATAQCDARYLLDWKTDSAPGGTERLPVVQVCWFAAEAFCAWLGPGFRLPTEAEWEGAARGPHDGQRGEYWDYAFGNEATCADANYDICGQAARPVDEAGGTSVLGVRGLAGNAWEWVGDWYRRDYYCDPDGLGDHISPNCDTAFTWSDPTGDAQGGAKVLRGGSYGHEVADMRSASRANLGPEMSSDFSGLRCARTAP